MVLLSCFLGLEAQYIPVVMSVNQIRLVAEISWSNKIIRHSFLLWGVFTNI